MDLPAHDRMGSPLTLCLRQCVLGLLSLLEGKKILKYIFARDFILSQNANRQDMDERDFPHYTAMDQSYQHYPPL